MAGEDTLAKANSRGWKGDVFIAIGILWVLGLVSIQF